MSKLLSKSNIPKEGGTDGGVDDGNVDCEALMAEDVDFWGLIGRRSEEEATEEIDCKKSTHVTIASNPQKCHRLHISNVVSD
ncbi:hypothetical protein L2E82_26937 [Cichorium intybus]|uniref:Uncharacterized protein n=1 Tax=Cichorium intybus TaxID=13427 RepID=A0ACB9CRZ8_CICIN|nr:hypothetical protein L2E82_26937 [Cichorium intybus]